VVAVTSEQKDGRNWEGGHRVAVEVAGQSVKDVIDRDGKSVNPRNPYWPYVTSNLGTVKLAKAGSYKLSFQPEQVENAKKLGLTLVSVRLVPAK
jgi:hypothetical protein